MKVTIPTTVEELRSFGFIENEGDAHPAGALETGLLTRLAELAQYVPPEAEIILARDWEGCLCALMQGSPWCDVLAFTDGGAIGYGGINQPLYFDSVKELRDDDARRRAERGDVQASILIGVDLSEEDLRTLGELIDEEGKADPLRKHLPNNQEAMDRIDHALDLTLLEIERKAVHA